MKVHAKILALAAAATLSAASCDTYRMVTRINSDGSCTREVYAEHDTFLYARSGWDCAALGDTGRRKDGYKFRFTRTFASPAEVGATVQSAEVMRPLAVPEEVLSKRFRWFYTYYSFCATYRTLAAQLAVPVGRYMSESEQRWWFQGDLSGYRGANGCEISDDLSAAKKHFFRWYARLQFEEYVAALADVLAEGESAVTPAQLRAARDSVFVRLAVKDDFLRSDLDMVKVNAQLDKFFGRPVFTALYASRGADIIKAYDERQRRVRQPQEALYIARIGYELTMPGTLLASNAPICRHDTLVWTVDALRFTAHDYVLTAESRRANVWAFAVVALLALLAVWGRWWTWKNRRLK